MSTTFYDKVLNKLGTFLEPSSNQSGKELRMSKEPENKQLRESFQLRRSSNSIKAANRTHSTKQNSFQENNTPMRQSVPLVDKQKRIEQLEETLHEERTKNSSYLNEIYRLNERVEELEYHIKEANSPSKYKSQREPRDLTYSYCEKKPNTSVTRSPNERTNESSSNSSPNPKQSIKGIDTKDYELLLKENEELRRFKEEVYSISKMYDNINENVIVSLQEMDKLFTKINEAKYHMTYTKKAGELAKAQGSFENVINTIIEMMKGKQEEYNCLVKEREKEIEDLKAAIEPFKKKVATLEETLEKSRCKFEHCCHHQCGECQRCYQCPHQHQHCKEASPEMDYMQKRMRKQNTNLSS